MSAHLVTMVGPCSGCCATAIPGAMAGLLAACECGSASLAVLAFAMPDIATGIHSGCMLLAFCKQHNCRLCIKPDTILPKLTTAMRHDKKPPSKLTAGKDIAMHTQPMHKLILQMSGCTPDKVTAHESAASSRSPDLCSHLQAQSPGAAVARQDSAATAATAAATPALPATQLPLLCLLGPDWLCCLLQLQACERHAKSRKACHVCQCYRCCHHHWLQQLSPLHGCQSMLASLLLVCPQAQQPVQQRRNTARHLQ